MGRKSIEREGESEETLGRKLKRRREKTGGTLTKKKENKSEDKKLSPTFTCDWVPTTAAFY